MKFCANAVELHRMGQLDDEGLVRVSEWSRVMLNGNKKENEDQSQKDSGMLMALSRNFKKTSD